jgi:acetoacetate decarboxylase
MSPSTAANESDAARIVHKEHKMKEADVKARAFAMPLTSPAYPPGPYRFVNREFLIITYRTDPDKLRAVVPEPLEVDEPFVKYEFKPPIAGGRELWGFPKKLAAPTLHVEIDQLVGTLDYGPVRVVTATMGYKHKPADASAIRASLAAPNFLLKIIPHVDGSPRICELVEYYLEDVTLKGAWTGPAAISLTPHALAPVAELPVLEVVSAVHLVCDLTLGLGKVVHDYLQPSAKREAAPKPATAGVA